MAKILFFSEGVGFQIKQKRLVKNWIISIAESESFHVKQIDFIFCSDVYLLNINKQFLSHDYYTDIITFDRSDSGDKYLESDIYISIERVLENAENLGLGFTEELYRVMSHGVLHLLGYNDKSKIGAKKMRAKESEHISSIGFHVKQNYKIK